MTCFSVLDVDNTSKLHQYSGLHDSQPENKQALVAVNTYSEKFELVRREEYVKEAVANEFVYEYPSGGSKPASRLPTIRTCVKGGLDRQVAHYDDTGYITHGSYYKDSNLVSFKFWYRSGTNFDDQLLRAEFDFAHISMRVSWCVPPFKHTERADEWIPNNKVIEATFTEGSDIWRSIWSYDHRWHPSILTTLNGKPKATPAMIQHDWFGVLSKPTNCSFLADNPVFSFKSLSTSVLSRALRLNTKRFAVSTSVARTHLWKTWKGSKDYDAVTVRWLDEMALRADSVLRPYWTYRDRGMLRSAARYLDLQADAIVARADVDPEVSSWSTLAYKYSDLCSFGQGGDTGINTRSQLTQLEERDETLHVLALDTGTWPIEGGGVSACRRDMVNDLKTIRWHVMAESANDFGVPKFQIERNVQSVTILPLWGLDFLSPTHGMFQGSLDSAVQRRSHNTREADIIKNFFPILTSLVKCSRAIVFTSAHIEEASSALVDLNTYFQDSRHWGEVWNHDIVKEKWRELWLREDWDNVIPASDWLHAQRPTLDHFDNALDMWHRCKFWMSGIASLHS